MNKNDNQGMKDDIKVTFWGVRGTLPVPGLNSVLYGGNTSCVSVEFPNDNFFILRCRNWDQGTVKLLYI